MSNLKDNVNKEYKRKFGISYEEFKELDFDQQQELINESKNNSDKSIIMTGGGDQSIFNIVSKGERIKTKDGYYIAGETVEENIKRRDKRMEESNIDFNNLNYKLTKEYKRSIKLDFKTWLFLFITNAIKVDHPPVVEVENKRTMFIKDCKKQEVYTFKDFDEYKKFFLMYLNDIENNIIERAIYTRGSNGQIVAFKKLCNNIIVRKKINEFYKSISNEKIDEIHSKGKITPLEAVQLWESLNLCIEGSQAVSSKDRCDFFDNNCHYCLLESATHQVEYDPKDYEIDESFVEEKKLVKTIF